MKKLVTVILFCFSLSIFSQAPEKLFSEANTFYKVEDYQRALDVYLSIEEQGYQSSDLYFNLGNTYYKLNKVAPAIYYFEKALKLNPANEDAAFNLAFAKRMTIDVIEELPKTFLQKFSINVIQKLPFDTWALIAVIASFLTALFFLIYFFSSSSKKKLIYFNTTILTLVIMLVTVIFAYKNYDTVQLNRTAIIFATKAVIKNAPTKSSEEAFELHEGTKVIILDELDDWKKIKIADGKVGWINDQLLKEI